MGVPALFRWLEKKYPKIVSPVIEEEEQEVDGVKIPVDCTKPNPNGEEFDNLYLDMNGIVHPCSHPEDKEAPKDEVEMMLAVFEYTARVVRMARPRKLLYLAVDGVAPRAKQNQQRKRRFMSAREAAEKDEKKSEFDKMLRDKRMEAYRPRGDDDDDDDQGEEDASDDDNLPKKTWDSNAITPGTPFMHLLAESLKYWSQYMLNTDPAWANLKVIISDASVPGEGEHKIMNFVRSQRRSADHDPNTRHVIYGLDADLIMLGLVTHEPHFRVLREDVFFDSKKNLCRKCNQPGHYADQCTGEIKPKDPEDEHKNAEPTVKPFIWLHISVLREYLAEELNVPSLPFAFELERALDDWVFMCFFVGNDFLPHLPSLEIRENGIDTLIGIWRRSLRQMGGFVTKDGQVVMERAQLILQGLAAQEDGIFRKRKANDDRREQGMRDRAAREKAQEARRNGGGMPPAKRVKETSETYANVPSFVPGELQSNEARQITHDQVMKKHAPFDLAAHDKANISAAAALKEKLRGKKQNTNESEVATEEDSSLGKRKADAIEDNDAGTPAVEPEVKKPSPDTVKLWEEGYAERYYEQKFKVDASDFAFRHKVGRDYMEGLCWVLLYYLQGCPSWTWYYPHHYAPFAADFVGIAEMSVTFDKGKPFRPYEQLMAVLPAASNHAIPEAYRILMSDSNSPIIDFYPVDFVLDLNGKPHEWQGIALLPFIDMDLLLKTMSTKEHLLTEEQKARNEVGEETLIFSTQHPLYDSVTSAFYSKKAEKSALPLDTKLSNGLIGEVIKDELYIPHSALHRPVESDDMPEIENNQAISLIYKMPRSKSPHKSMLLTNLTYPTPVLNDGDKSNTRDRAGGNRGNYRGGYNNRGNSNGRGRGNSHNGYNNGNSSESPQVSSPPDFIGPVYVKDPTKVKEEPKKKEKKGWGSRSGAKASTAAENPAPPQSAFTSEIMPEVPAYGSFVAPVARPVSTSAVIQRAPVMYNTLPPRPTAVLPPRLDSTSISQYTATYEHPEHGPLSYPQPSPQYDYWFNASRSALPGRNPRNDAYAARNANPPQTASYGYNNGYNNGYNPNNYANAGYQAHAGYHPPPQNPYAQAGRGGTGYAPQGYNPYPQPQQGPNAYGRGGYNNGPNRGGRGGGGGGQNNGGYRGRDRY